MTPELSLLPSLWVPEEDNLSQRCLSKNVREALIGELFAV